MFRRLANDHWVLGIAAAIALGYAIVEFVRALANRVLPFVANDDDFGTIEVEPRGRSIPLDEVVTALVTLVAVIVIAAVALRRAAPQRVGE